VEDEGEARGRVIMSDSRLDNWHDNNDDQDANTDTNDDSHLHVLPPVCN
jgi:hypothetical protein